MRIIAWSLGFLIPLVVLFTIGYYVPGFSALTIPWLIFLSALILLGDGLIHRLVDPKLNRFGGGLVTFLVSLAVIFLTTLAIRGGNVPLGGAILASLIIAVLNNIIVFQRPKKGSYFR